MYKTERFKEKRDTSKGNVVTEEVRYNMAGHFVSQSASLCRINDDLFKLLKLFEWKSFTNQMKFTTNTNITLVTSTAICYDKSNVDQHPRSKSTDL